jgi:hypothetical protein
VAEALRLVKNESGPLGGAVPTPSAPAPPLGCPLGQGDAARIPDAPVSATG